MIPASSGTPGTVSGPRRSTQKWVPKGLFYLDLGQTRPRPIQLYHYSWNWMGQVSGIQISANNKKTLTWSVSGPQIIPDPLNADLKIVSVRSDGSGGLFVTVENGGPDVIKQTEATVSCEATQVSRTDGSSTTIKDLEQMAVLNLNAQSRQTFKLTTQTGSINLLTHWYQVSCQV